jgi:copper/silver efflux system protein
VLALAVLGATALPAMKLGSEFMPTLNEGTLLFMPVSLPGLSVTKAAELLQTQDRIIKSFPEVESVFGKAGRAATATDPAPVEMSETVVNLKPESQWRPGVTIDSLIAEMGRALEMPGVSSAWTMPIKARIDMLSTGIRTPVGIKVCGPDLAGVDSVSREVEAVVRQVSGTTSAFAERIEGGYFLEIEPDRAALARYGLTVGDLQETITTALGGESVTTTVDGRARYTVNVRYARGLRTTPDAIAHHRWRGGARAAQDDDGDCHHGGIATDPMEHRYGIGTDAAHRRPDGRRHDQLRGLTWLVIPTLYALTKGWKLAASERAADDQWQPRAVTMGLDWDSDR